MRRSGLLTVALLGAAAAAASTSALAHSPVYPSSAPARRRVAVQRMAISSSREIQEWNKAVEARKLAKKGRP